MYKTGNIYYVYNTAVNLLIILLFQIGEMEVRNPLFQDDPTPAQTPAVKSTEDLQKK